jgi:hypothetical protein
VENIASALVNHTDTDFHDLREKANKAFQKLMENGWVVEEEGRYRLLSGPEHDLERDVRKNLPSPSELQRDVAEPVRSILERFRYEHGQIRRPLNVNIDVDGQTVRESGDLRVCLFTQFAEDQGLQAHARH